MGTGKQVIAAGSMKELERFVHDRLCLHDRLDRGQAPLLRGMMRRGGKPCGLFFQVEGPRLTRGYALWVSEEHRLLFYDSAGARFDEVFLSEAPAAA
jgi:hypothetical protein